MAKALMITKIDPEKKKKKKNPNFCIERNFSDFFPKHFRSQSLENVKRKK